MFVRAGGLAFWMAIVGAHPLWSQQVEGPKVGVQGSKVTLDGQPVELLGYGSVGYLYQAEYDYGALVARLAQHHINFLRVSVSLIPEHWSVNGDPPRQPIRKFGGFYQFNDPDPVFWKRFDTLAKAAAAKKIVVSATLWDCYSLRTKSEYKHHPLHPDNGGFLVTADQTAFPNFWTTTFPQVEQFNQVVLAKLAQYPNVIVEAANEPAPRGAPISSVENWHHKIYSKRDFIRPDLPILVNLVPADDALSGFFPNAHHPGVDLVSFHGTPGLHETAAGTAQRIGKIRQTIGMSFKKPMVVDTDGLNDTGKVLEGRNLDRNFNTFLHTWAVGALWAGAGFNHLEKDAWKPALDDVGALDAIGSAREAATQPESWPSVSGWLSNLFSPKRSKFPVGEFADLALDGNGRPHGVYLLGSLLYYAVLTGSTWQVEAVTSLNNVRREFNVPQIAVVGDRVYVVYGGPSQFGNGFFVQRRIGPGSWTTPIHVGRRNAQNQIIDWFESFDAVSFGDSLHIVADNLKGGGHWLERIVVKNDGTYSIAPLSEHPEGEADVAAGTQVVHFAARFKGVRIGHYDPAGVASSSTFSVAPGSAGYAQVALGADGLPAYAWVRWKRLHPQKSYYEPVEIWVRTQAGTHIKIVDVQDRFCSGRIDLAVDYFGRPVVAYDLGGKIHVATVGTTGTVATKVLAYGFDPRIRIRLLARTVLFGGPRSGSVSGLSF